MDSAVEKASDTPSEELKACPFCGEPPFAPIYDDHPINKWLVICDECETEGPHKHTEAEAIAAWNLRPTSSRRSVLEEAARVAEGLAAELSRLKGSGDRRVQIGSHLETCATIASAIRALAEEEP